MGAGTGVGASGVIMFAMLVFGSRGAQEESIKAAKVTVNLKMTANLFILFFIITGD